MQILNESAPLTGDVNAPLDLGAWIGKSQTFGLISNRCSAAQAECLQHLRESRAYQSLGLSWDQFCPQHLGISRAWADDLISRLEEFGPGFFQLSQIAPVSPESYRLLAPAISDQGIEIDGESIAITPENAPRIRRAIVDLRADLRRARQNIKDPDVTVLQNRFDNWFDQLSSFHPSPLDAGSCAARRGLITYCRHKLDRLATQ
ncbi:MAG TPA: hypothetical protein VKT49_05810 [Bryobacteraceae bacterium]|nr:hypothetical protein [Bryobacteraceae bacterium]